MSYIGYFNGQETIYFKNSKEAHEWVRRAMRPLEHLTGTAGLYEIKHAFDESTEMKLSTGESLENKRLQGNLKKLSTGTNRKIKKKRAT